MRVQPTNGSRAPIDPAPTPEEAAAIVAALERFVRASAPTAATRAEDTADPWWRAGILEGVESELAPDEREPWMR